MKLKKLLLSLLATGVLVTSLVNTSFATTKIVLTRQQAIQKYWQYYPAYKKDELVKIEQYRHAYKRMKGSLGDQVVERAFWYMQNGYMVYGHGINTYARKGIIDSGTFVKLVYGDFGISIPGNDRYQGTVGSPITGITPVKINNTWLLKGVEKLRPGDMLGWWKLNPDGTKFIVHTAIYMGYLNGQPMIIGTSGKNNPTAVGIVNDFRWWYGSNFYLARRLLPSGAWTPGRQFSGLRAKKPVIPQTYVLPPQKRVVMP